MALLLRHQPKTEEEASKSLLGNGFPDTNGDLMEKQPD